MNRLKCLGVQCTECAKRCWHMRQRVCSTLVYTIYTIFHFTSILCAEPAALIIHALTNPLSFSLSVQCPLALALVSSQSKKEWYPPILLFKFTVFSLTFANCKRGLFHLQHIWIRGGAAAASLHSHFTLFCLITRRR